MVVTVAAGVMAAETGTEIWIWDLETRLLIGSGSNWIIMGPPTTSIFAEVGTGQLER